MSYFLSISYSICELVSGGFMGIGGRGGGWLGGARGPQTFSVVPPGICLNDINSEQSCNSIYCLVCGWLKCSQYKFNRQTYRLDRL